MKFCLVIYLGLGLHGVKGWFRTHGGCKKYVLFFYDKNTNVHLDGFTCCDVTLWKNIFGILFSLTLCT